MKRILATAAAIAITGAAAAHAESLWEQGRCVNPCGDLKARSVGDILTVIIDERAVISKESSRSTSKEESTDLGVQLFRLFGWEGDSNHLPALQWDSSREFDGEADYESTDTFTKRLSLIVKEVQPNGNLLIEGSRRISTAGDDTTITISGIVRPQDISADNTVPSELVAEATIAYDATGPSADNTRRGWFLKLLDFIWPF